MRKFFGQTRLGIALVVVCSFLVSCSTQATSQYWGEVDVPQDNVMRYITGSEPESLDPSFVTGQPEARIMVALYDRLVEYHPKTMEPIPAMATHWETDEALLNYTFHLRKNGKFSNGDPIKAQDFVYSIRRALSPELASRYAFIGYDIKYADSYNAGKSFVKDGEGYLLAKDLSSETPKPENPSGASQSEPQAEKDSDEDSEDEIDFEKYINSPARLAVASDPFALAKEMEGNEKLKNHFKYKPSDLTDAAAFAKKIESSSDALTEFVKPQIDQSAIKSCQSEVSCTEASRKAIIEDINKILTDSSLYTSERFSSLELTEKSEKFIEKLDKANAKIEKDNEEIDKQVAELEDPEKKKEKAESKKKPITKLFFMNRFLFGEFFGSGLDSLPLQKIKAEDIGIHAVDDYTVRITLKQTAPYFVGMLPHQFFGAVHKPTIETHGKNWIKAENIVTSGPFKVKYWNPYDELAVEKDPNYWDAENVKLDGIVFYPMDEQTTMMNIYKAGRVDALYNHTVPAAWNEYIRQFKDEYLLHPEITIEYYTFSVKKPPVDKLEVRKAFALAVDRDALEKYRKTVKKSADFTPPGIFPKYEEARKKVYAEKIKEAGISAEEFEKRLFNPQKACELMKKAGYSVTMDGEKCKVTDFPADDIQLSYNTAESNKQVAEFVQQQWKQNLGITVQLKNMEWKTYLKYRSAVEYNGVARAGWVGDYMDPFTFLSQFYTEKNDSSTGWWDPKFDKMMDEANQTRDPQERLEKLAAAEFYLLADQPIMPLSVAGTSWMKKPYIKGMYPNPQTIHPWKFVYIEKDRNNWDKDVDNIMKEGDPKIDAEVEALMKTQKDFEASKSDSEDSSQTKDSESKQAEEE